MTTKASFVSVEPNPRVPRAITSGEDRQKYFRKFDSSETVGKTERFMLS